MSSRKKPNPNERIYAADNRPTFGPSSSTPPVIRSRAQNVPGVPAKGQGLDDFTKMRMEQSRSATANKTQTPPPHHKTPDMPPPKDTPPTPPRSTTPTPPDVTSRPTRPTPRPVPTTPPTPPRRGGTPPLMPTRSLGSGPTAPVNMGKLNQINSMVAGRPSPTPMRPSPTPMGRSPMRPMKTGGSVNGSASKRADGIATRGKTKGKMC